MNYRNTLTDFDHLGNINQNIEKTWSEIRGEMKNLESARLELTYVIAKGKVGMVFILNKVIK